MKSHGYLIVTLYIEPMNEIQIPPTKGHTIIKGSTYTKTLANGVIVNRGICARCGDTKVNINNGTPSLCATVTKIFNIKKEKREYIFLRESKCACCGYVPIEEEELEVHHRYGDHAKDRKDDVVTLCANCHRRTEATITKYKQGDDGYDVKFAKLITDGLIAPDYLTYCGK